MNDRILEIKEDLVSRGLPEEILNKKLEDRMRKFPYSEESLLKVVSGKDYLIPYFIRWSAKQLSCDDIKKLSVHQWKFFLVAHCNLERLNPLKKRILDLACR